MYATKAVGLTAVLGIWYAALKMTQMADWSWGEAMAPFWPFALILAAGLIGVGILLILQLELTREKMSRLSRALSVPPSLGSIFVGPERIRLITGLLRSALAPILVIANAVAAWGLDRFRRFEHR
jgi:hypothetical protein